jgi:hypothetical protein
MPLFTRHRSFFSLHELSLEMYSLRPMPRSRRISAAVKLGILS